MNCASRLQQDSSPSSRLHQSASLDANKHRTLKKNGDVFSQDAKKRETGDAKSSVDTKNGSLAETENLSDRKSTPSSSFLADVAGSSGDGVTEREAMKRALFGDGDSDSDLEDMDGKSCSNLCGKRVLEKN